MIRFKLAELLIEKSFNEGRKIEWQEVSSKSGLHRTTISRMLNVRGYNASTSNLDSLCKYFGCELGQLAVYIPDSELDVPVEKSFRGPKSALRKADGEPIEKAK